ncbi:T9SS type A sorting domain-containing protein [Flavobacterium sp.]|uniref:T9SS type A sorting domain-containing protein n=1 Tax=Flavobacterium sp. TaxID=239 RepID=UPI0035294080
MKKILLLALWLAFNYNSSAQVFDWVRTTGGPAGESASKIATDALGNVYAMGSYTGTLDINPSSGTLNVTAVGGTDIYIQKFDASGTFINGISIGGPGNDTPGDILIDNNGYVTVAGTFEQVIDLDPSPAQNGHAVYNFGTSKDFFIAKYDDLAYAFSRSIGGAGDDVVNAMDVDSNNNLVLTGIYRQTVDFNPNINITNSLTTTSGGEAYVLKLDEHLDYVWVKSFATTNSNGGVGTTIRCDSTDNILVGGTFRGTTDFDPNAGVQNETAQTNFSAGFIVKLNSSGDYSWKATLNTTNNNAAGVIYNGSPETWLRDLTIDTNDNIIAVGTFRGRNVDFNPTSGTVTFNSDIYVQTNPDISTYKNTGYIWKLNSTGDYEWAGLIKNGGTNTFLPFVDVSPLSVAVDELNDFYVTGFFKGIIDLNTGSGNNSVTNNVDYDSFIFKNNSSNNAYVWGRRITSTDDACYVNDLHIFENKLLLSGRFGGTGSFDPNNISAQTVTSQGDFDVFLLSLTETSLNTASFEKNDFVIYPNPVTTALAIQSTLNDFDYKMYTADGKVVKQGTIDATRSSIDVSTLPSGLYFIHFESDGYQTVRKIIKQ